MKNLSFLHILCLVLAAMMLFAIAPLPYGYYVLVRFAGLVVFGYMSFLYYSEGRTDYAIVAGIFALLFQPFVKVALGRDVWQIVDACVGACLLVYVIWDHRRMSSVSRGSIRTYGKTSNGSIYRGLGNDVFISYSSRDRYDSFGRPIPGNIIDKITAELDKEGISYWIDKNGLSGGTTFPSEIAKQIRNAKCMVYVSSANSNASSWTMNEIATANTYGKPIIPFRYDLSSYNPSIMIYLAAVHYILYPGNAMALQQLTNAIKKIL